MNRSLLRVYHALPYPLRSAAAGAWGRYLRWLRYGPESEELVRQALERDYWTEEKWRTWRQERLAVLLHHAATTVPFYRRHWSERRARGDSSSWEDLENWPLLDKESVRRNPEAFIAESSSRETLHRWYTSGSTGTPLSLFLSRSTMRQWYALFEARSRRWYGVSRQDSWALVGGQSVASNGSRKWVWNSGLKQLYVSALHVAAPHTVPILEALEEHRVRYIVGYPAALDILAQAARDAGRTVPLRVAICNSESLLEHQRGSIREVFQCPVRETYGCAEIVAGAGECECGAMHLWPDTGIVEVFDSGIGFLPPGRRGELVCTGLLNFDMPLIRYRIGDSGAIGPAGTDCPCGRRLPLLKSLEGRLDDILIAPDGRRVARVDGVFKGPFDLRETQVVQESITRIRVTYTAPAQLSDQDRQEISRRFVEIFGPISLHFERVPRIPRLPNGKFRSAACLVPREQWPSPESGRNA